MGSAEPRTRPAIVLTALATVAFSASCSGGGKKVVTTTTTPPRAPATTVAPVVVAPGNPRVTTTLPPEIEGGDATLTGSVVGPGGPVDGATVHVERLVDDVVTAGNAESLPGGRWQLVGIRGGRYRVRAWKVPDLAQVQPEVLFLGATETKEVPLTVTAFGQGGVVGAVEPSPPQVGQPANVLVQVSSATVGADGIVRQTPRSGVAVQLAVTGGAALQAPPLQTTDVNGAAAWKVQCNQPGPFSATAAIAGVTTPLALPPCSQAPAPTTATTAG